MATCRILFVRHGETVWNREGRCQGSSDIPLSEIGLEQAEALAAALARETVAAVYSSDLARARRTADAIAIRHRLSVTTEARLRELNQGKLEGQSLKEMLAGQPELLKKWMTEPADVCMPGGESMRTMQARAGRALDEIIRRHPDQTVVIVGHGLCTRSLLCRALEIDLNRFRIFRLDNASISETESNARGTVLVRVNDTHHLGRKP